MCPLGVHPIVQGARYRSEHPQDAPIVPQVCSPAGNLTDPASKQPAHRQNGHHSANSPADLPESHPPAYSPAETPEQPETPAHRTDGNHQAP